MTGHSRLPRGSARQRLPRLLVAAGLVGLVLVPASAQAVVSTTPEGFSGVAGVDGAVGGATDARVYAILEAAGRIYVGGQFTSVVAPDGTTVARRNLIALDAATGLLDTSFAPDPGNAVRALEISPDGSRLYVAGPFARIGDQDHGRLAALDAATGAPIPGWQVDADAPVWSLELSADGILYAGGMFTNLTDATGGHPRANLAAIDAAAGRVIDGWVADTVGYTESAPLIDPVTGDVVRDPVTGLPIMQTTLQPGFVRAIQMSYDQSSVLVGGEFVSVRGVSLRNLAVLDPHTAAVNRDFADSSRRVFDIEVDASRIYTALGGGGGEGRALNPLTGRTLWAVNGNGDFQAVAVIGDVVYLGGHFGTETTNASFEGQPRTKLAAVEAATGDLLPFAPDINSALGVWTLRAHNHNLHVGGDFTRVGGAGHSHYVRLTGQPERPDPPTAVTATAGDGQATVNWAAPAYDGLRPITGYVITPYREAAAQTSVYFPSPATAQTVTGLDNGVGYTFTVAAVNELGPSEESELSVQVTALGLPTMAAPPAATAGNGEVRLSWAEAADDGGSPVSSYLVTPYRDGLPQTPQPVTAPDRSLTLTGLPNGVSYAFTVAAVNVAGPGPPSPPSATVTPHTTPGVPRDVTASAGNEQATVRWAAPADDGGSPVTGYVVTPFRHGVAGAAREYPGGQTVGIVTGLDNGAAYAFTVAAKNAAGQGGPSAATPAVIPGSGYWMIDSSGKVYPFGGARGYGDEAGRLGSAVAVDIEATPSADGYWILTDTGGVYAHGDAPALGGIPAGALRAGERATGLSATPTGGGYWIFTGRGRVFARGDAAHLGDLASVPLNGPVLDSVATPSGRGYYMVASDGGIFTFGDAVFAGSMGGRRLNAPVMSMAADPDGDGYWLVASDGGIFAFRAAFHGSMGGAPLNQPIKGMVANGHGYLLVATDGGIFNFSDRPFHGSLGANPPSRPISAVATL